MHGESIRVLHGPAPGSPRPPAARDRRPPPPFRPRGGNAARPCREGGGAGSGRAGTPSWRAGWGRGGGRPGPPPFPEPGGRGADAAGKARGFRDVGAARARAAATFWEAPGDRPPPTLFHGASPSPGAPPCPPGPLSPGVASPARAEPTPGLRPRKAPFRPAALRGWTPRYHSTHLLDILGRHASQHWDPPSSLTGPCPPWADTCSLLRPPWKCHPGRPDGCLCQRTQESKGLGSGICSATDPSPLWKVLFNASSICATAPGAQIRTPEAAASYGGWQETSHAWLRGRTGKHLWSVLWGAVSSPLGRVGECILGTSGHGPSPELLWPPHYRGLRAALRGARGRPTSRGPTCRRTVDATRVSPAGGRDRQNAARGRRGIVLGLEKEGAADTCQDLGEPRGLGAE
ncbi:nascent polypeptide-associated complex subunit alpha, muscle-specific form-like [Mustela erminea]|uniref:nascent polypeptide-associated complex subunit alpha, muscle-specific form-like n=1 Tax=Mustela erminea TaxID=36723 RepID=UPI001386B5C1|nr:nascent polypeptide-associated complex subunit alpha, muscle-specific form-like [Mustela erminea]